MFGQRDTSSTDDANQQSSTPVLPMPDYNSQMPASLPVTTAPSVPNFDIPAPEQLSSPVTNSPQPPVQTSPEVTSDITPEDLVSMKQEALQHLQPLVDTLEQSPEEEFRTIMMMIQATDDKKMLKKALESAKKIKDDKIRAQAMLDVINEINYFTQTSQAE
ncbi:MAG: hypothetical protein WCJ60_00310 [bacterium]